MGKAFLVTFFFVLSLAQANPPPATENARKESKSDPTVITDDVDKMKQDVLNKKTQMLLFRELLRNEGIESNFPTVILTHVNQMGARFKINSLNYTLDKDRVYTFHADDNLTHQDIGKETKVFKGPLVPGIHTLLVEIVYQGNDTGVFSYINDYKIPVQVKKTFKVTKGQSMEIQVIGYEKGWALTDFKDRPDLKVKFYSSSGAKELK